jgi:hypothetical protein
MTTHRYPLGPVDAAATVPCCGQLLLALPTLDLVALPGSPASARIDCPGASNLPIGGMLQSMADGQRQADAGDAGDIADARSTPAARAERAAWTKDLAEILRGLTAVDPELLPGLVYAADFLDPLPPVAGKALVMAGPPPTTRTPQEIEGMGVDEREQMAATEEIDAAQERAELDELRKRVEGRAQQIGAMVQQAMQVKKINPLSLESAELRVRLEVLSDAAFGDGTRDQLGYELAVQDKFITLLEQYSGKADEIHAARETEARRAMLLDGISRHVPPGGRR